MPAVVLDARFKSYKGPDREIAGATFKVPGFVLLVEVTLVQHGRVNLPQDARWVPAIIDTGFSGSFFIATDHLELLGGPRNFRLIPVKGESGKPTATYGSGETAPFDQYEGDIWIRNAESDLAPLKLELNGGFAVPVPAAGRPGPRIPLIGAASLATANLLLTVDYHLLRFTLQTVDPASVLHIHGQSPST